MLFLLLLGWGTISITHVKFFGCVKGKLCFEMGVLRENLCLEMGVLRQNFWPNIGGSISFQILFQTSFVYTSLNCCTSWSIDMSKNMTIFHAADQWKVPFLFPPYSNSLPSVAPPTTTWSPSSGARPISRRTRRTTDIQVKIIICAYDDFPSTLTAKTPFLFLADLWKFEPVTHGWAFKWAAAKNKDGFLIEQSKKSYIISEKKNCRNVFYWNIKHGYTQIKLFSNRNTVVSIYIPIFLTK